MHRQPGCEAELGHNALRSRVTAHHGSSSPLSAGDTSRLGLPGRDQAWPPQRVLVAAASVSAAYFLGPQLGLLLRVPGATPSVLWPPNALLTCALLLVPPRYWWACLLAVVPAHLTLSSGTGWPLPMVAGLLATNVSEAMIGAGLLRRLSDRP